MFHDEPEWHVTLDKASFTRAKAEQHTIISKASNTATRCRRCCLWHVFRGQQLRRPTSSPRSLLLDLDFKVEHRNDPRWNRESCANVKFQYHPAHFVFSTYFRESQVCRFRLFFHIWPLLQQALPVAEWLSWRSVHQKRWLRLKALSGILFPCFVNSSVNVPTWNQVKCRWAETH